MYNWLLSRKVIETGTGQYLLIKTIKKLDKIWSHWLLRDVGHGHLRRNLAPEFCRYGVKNYFHGWLNISSHVSQLSHDSLFQSTLFTSLNVMARKKVVFFITFAFSNDPLLHLLCSEGQNPGPKLHVIQCKMRAEQRKLCFILIECTAFDEDRAWLKRQ